MTSVRGLRASLNHKVFSSPPELAEDRSVAVVGTLEEITEGQSVVASYPEERVRVRDNTMVFRIKVDRAYRSSPGDISPSGDMFVSLPRGVTEIDEEGNVIGVDPSPSIDRIREEIPRGVRVAVIASAEPRLLEGPETFGKDPNVVPEDTNLLFGGHPQTVTIDQGGDQLDEWPGFTFAELESQLEKP